MTLYQQLELTWTPNFNHIFILKSRLKTYELVAKTRVSDQQLIAERQNLFKQAYCVPLEQSKCKLNHQTDRLIL